MTYTQKLEYEIKPLESFRAIRKCSGCGIKTHFRNTGCFRVNANKNKLDIWLIYQCETCKHTLNLTIYSRRKATSISADEYKYFLANDETLAHAYGTNLQFFKQNQMEVDLHNINYIYQQQTPDSARNKDTDIDTTEEANSEEKQVHLIIHNPCPLKIRPEKQIAELLGLSVSCVKKHVKRNNIHMKIIPSETHCFFKKCLGLQNNLFMINY